MSTASKELVAVAETLLQSDYATQSHLRRAISTAYYALFQHLIDDCCTQLLGDGDELVRAKIHFKRSIGHKEIKSKCKSVSSDFDFPEDLVLFSNTVVDLQNLRCKADYDDLTSFTDGQAATVIEQSKDAIDRFEAVDCKHRRAFAIWIARERKNYE